MSARPVGVVLTGGRSTRMGSDKATTVVDGKPMAVRVADALWEAGCHPVECQGGDVEALFEYGLDAHPDEMPDQGPVAGIVQAMRRHPGADVVVAACDLVDITADTIAALVEAEPTGDGGAPDAAVAVSGGRRHLAVLLRAGTDARIADAPSFLEALARIGAHDVEVAARAVLNVNSPADLEARGRVDDV